MQRLEPEQAELPTYFWCWLMARTEYVAQVVMDSPKEHHGRWHSWSDGTLLYVLFSEALIMDTGVLGSHVSYARHPSNPCLICLPL